MLFLSNMKVNWKAQVNPLPALSASSFEDLGLSVSGMLQSCLPGLSSPHRVVKGLRSSLGWAQVGHDTMSLVRILTVAGLPVRDDWVAVYQTWYFQAASSPLLA